MSSADEADRITKSAADLAAVSGTSLTAAFDVVTQATKLTEDSATLEQARRLAVAAWPVEYVEMTDAELALRRLLA